MKHKHLNNNEQQTQQCDKHPINVVDKQVYLGLTLTPSGRFTCAREILVKKGNKILASVKRMLSNCDYIPSQVYCKLFDTVIKPALFYGNEIWGPELFEYKTHIFLTKASLNNFI